MGLTLRRTRLAHPPSMAYLEDWTILDNGKPVGRLYQTHTTARTIIWHWSITVYVEPRSGLSTSGTAGTLEAANAAFRDTWDKLKAC
jgi:hypothetical protein